MFVVPNQFAIDRPSKCEVEYLDYMVKDIKAEGLLQHVSARDGSGLEGILFIDYLSKLKNNDLKPSKINLPDSCIINEYQDNFYGHTIICCSNFEIIVSKWLSNISYLYNNHLKISRGQKINKSPIQGIAENIIDFRAPATLKDNKEEHEFLKELMQILQLL